MVYLTFRKIARETPVLQSFFNKAAGLRPDSLKDTLAQVFSCEF